MKSNPSTARSAIGSHRCSLGGPQCPDEVNMSGSGSPLTSGPLDEERRERGGGIKATVRGPYSHGDVLFMNGSRANRPTFSSKEVAAPTEQPSSCVKGTVRHLREHRKCRLDTRLFDGDTLFPRFYLLSSPLLRRKKRLLDNLTKSDVMELDGGKS